MKIVRHELTEEEKQAALASFFSGIDRITKERRAATELAQPALERLCEVMRSMTGQSYKIRALLYSLWNGQPTGLIEILALDWDLRKDLIAVLLAFGFEGRDGVKFFYDAVKHEITAAGIWAWFIEAHESEVAA
jgi:hypothetical protein